MLKCTCFSGSSIMTTAVLLLALSSSVSCGTVPKLKVFPLQGASSDDLNFLKYCQIMGLSETSDDGTILLCADRNAISAVLVYIKFLNTRLETTGSNLANANDPKYVRKKVVFNKSMHTEIVDDLKRPKVESVGEMEIFISTGVEMEFAYKLLRQMDPNIVLYPSLRESCCHKSIMNNNGDESKK